MSITRSFSDLPLEVLREELLPFLHEADLFVLAKTSHFLHAALAPHSLPAQNPLEYYARNGYINLIDWDQRGPAPCALSVDVLRNAVQYGDLAQVSFFLDDLKCPFNETVFSRAFGTLENRSYLWAFLRKRGVPMDPRRCIVQAARARNLEALTFLVESCRAQIEPSDLAEVIAVMTQEKRGKTESLKLIEFLFEKCGRRFDPRVLPFLARFGDLDLVQWALDRGAALTNPSFYSFAAGGGNVALMDFAFDRGLPLTNQMQELIGQCISEAVGAGHLSVLEWLVTKGHSVFTPFLQERCSLAWSLTVQNGHVDLLRFGLAHGLKLSHVYYTLSIGSRRPDIRAILEENNCPILGTALEAAVGERDRPLILTLKAKGFPLTFQASDTATELGDLGFLKWLVAQGCPVGESTLTTAARNGRLSFLPYLLDTLGLPLSSKITSTCTGPRSSKVLSALLARGATLDGPLLWKNLLTQPLRLPILNILITNRVPLTSVLAAQAAACHRLDLLQWLARNKCPMDFSELMSQADPRRTQPLPEPRYFTLPGEGGRGSQPQRPMNTSIALPPFKLTPAAQRVIDWISEQSKRHLAIR